MTIQAMLSGTSPITKTGNGTLTLSGTNAVGGNNAFTSYGGTTILDYSVPGARLHNGWFQLFGNNSIDLAGGTQTETVIAYNLNQGANSITRSSGSSVLRMGNFGRRDVGSTMNFGVASVAESNGTLTTNGIIPWATVSGTDWATKTTANNAPFTAFSSYTTTLPASGNNSTVNYFVTDSAPVTGNLQINSLKLATTTAGQSLAVSAGQTLTLSGNGLLFTGANDYSISGGSLTVGNGVGAYEAIVHQNGSGTLSIGSAIVNNGANATQVTKSGTGVLVLAGANTYTGTTWVSSGTLRAGAASVAGVSGPFGLNSSVVVGNAPGVVLDLNNYNVTVGSLVNGATTGGLMGGTVALGTGTLSVGANNANATYSGVIAGAGGLVKVGSGTWQLGTAAANTSFEAQNTFTGPLTIADGAIRVWALNNANTVGPLGNSDQPITLGSAGKTGELGTADATTQAVTNRSFVLAAGGTGRFFTWVQAASILTVNGGVSGSGDLQLVSRGGTISLNGANSFTGNVLARPNEANGNPGLARLGGPSLNTIGNIVVSGSSLVGTGTTLMTLRLSATSGGTSNNISGTATVRDRGQLWVDTTGTFSSPVVVERGGLFGVWEAPTGVGTTFAGLISGSGGFYVRASNLTTTVSGEANTFTGSATLLGNSSNLGVLRVAKLADAGVPSSLGAATGTDASINIGYARLIYTGTGDSTNRPINIVNSGWGSGPTQRIDLWHAGSGTLAFSGGVTNSGTSSGGGLNLMGATTGVGVISGPIRDGTSATITTDVIKLDPGLWVLSGSNTYSGTTSVQNGTLRLSGASSLGSGALLLDVTSSATAVIESNFNLIRPGGAGAGQMRLSGNTATEVVAGFSARGGDITVQFGTASPDALSWGTAPFVPGRSTLMLNASTADSTLTFTNPVNLAATTRTIQVSAATAIMSGGLTTASGSAGLIKTGTGTLVLSGTNT